MFENSDQKFLRALESPEEVEKLFAKLKRARRQSVICAVCGLAAFFVFFHMSINLAQRISGVAQTIILFGPFAYLLTPLMITIKAYNIQSQIRILIVFKKLRDDRSVVTP